MPNKEMIVIPLELFLGLTDIACEHNCPIAGTAIELKDKWKEIGPIAVPCTLVPNELLLELKELMFYSHSNQKHDLIEKLVKDQENN